MLIYFKGNGFPNTSFYSGMDMVNVPHVSVTLLQWLPSTPLEIQARFLAKTQVKSFA